MSAAEFNLGPLSASGRWLAVPRRQQLLLFCVILLSLVHESSCLAQRKWAVRGRITEHGKPVSARLYIHSESGAWYHARSADKDAPAAVDYHVQRSPTVVEIHTALPAGDFVADLPAGTYELTVERGKEYFTKSVTVEVPSQTDRVLEIPIERWIDMRSIGWYSGDTHVHRPVDQVSIPLLADDVNIAFPLTYWVTDSEITPIASSKSVRTPVQAETIQVDDNHLIYPLNTEYELFTYKGKRHTLGAVFVIGHKQPLDLVAPPTRPIADQARNEGALLDLDKHTWPWTPMIVPVMQVDLFELANNHIWRTGFLFRDWTIETLPDNWGIETDADGGWTEWGWIDFGFKSFYAYLNCGFDMRPTGGTATGVHPVPIGFGRVYVQLDEPFSAESWLRGLSAGHSFVTTGPLLMLSFNGKPAGTRFQHAIDVSSNPAIPCRITGTAASQTPLDRIEIIVNGELRESLKPGNIRQPNGSFRSPIDVAVSLSESSWVAVRCFEPRSNGRFFYAHTAATHYRINGHPVRPRRFEVRYLLQRVEAEMARNRDLLSKDELAEFEQARRIYQRLLEQAE